MGFNNDTLPASRTNFWGGQLMPIHGISPNEWWPTEEEASLVLSILMSEEYLESMDHHNRLNASEYDNYDVFEWFTENFTRGEYTNDYSFPVTNDLIWKGLTEFQKSNNK